MPYAGEIAHILERALQLLAQDRAFDESILAGLRTLYESGKLADENSIRASLERSLRAEEAPWPPE